MDNVPSRRKSRFRSLQLTIDLIGADFAYSFDEYAVLANVNSSKRVRVRFAFDHCVQGQMMDIFPIAKITTRMIMTGDIGEHGPIE